MSQGAYVLPQAIAFCRTKVRGLTKLGIFLRTAISAGLSRKGPWKLSRTLATQSGMTNEWLKIQGLLSVKDLWVSIHYLATRLYQFYIDALKSWMHLLNSMSHC